MFIPSRVASAARRMTSCNGLLLALIQSPKGPMNKHLVLIFAYHYPPEDVIGAARPYRFSKYLSRFGYECRVFTAARQIGRNDPNTEYVPDPFFTNSRRSARWQLERALRKLFLPGDMGMQWSYHASRAARAYLRAHPSTAVTLFSTYPPVGPHLAAWRLARNENLPWIADFRDPIPDGRKGKSAHPFHNRVCRWLERGIAQKASVLIANTDAAMAKWQEKFPTLHGKAQVISNGFDPEERIVALPTASGPYRVLSHTGELYGGRTAKPILESIARLIATNRLPASGLRVRLVGTAEPESLPDQEFLIRAQSEGWLDFTARRIPKAEACQIAQSSDGLLLLQPQSTTQVPGKLFEYLQIGRPILAFLQPDSPSERLLAHSGVPYRCVYPDSPPEVVDSIVTEFFTIPSAPVAASPWFENLFNAEKQTRQLDALIRSLREGTKGGIRIASQPRTHQLKEEIQIKVALAPLEEASSPIVELKHQENEAVSVRELSSGMVSAVSGTEIARMDSSPHFRPTLLVTIDTESDDLWAGKPELTFENIRHLPRLQRLFERYGLRPTYLVSYPVATSEIGCKVLKPIVRDGRAEIGSHMHVWTTPPIVPVTPDDNRYCPLATEIPYELLATKMENVTRAVGELSGTQPVSHRAGRFGFDPIGMRVLQELGYVADTSVTPLVSWLEPSCTGGQRGADFRSAPFEPYYPSEEDVTKPGAGTLLEVPVSIFLSRPLPPPIANRLARLPHNNNVVRALRWTGLVRQGWLSPGRETNGKRLIGMARALIACGVPMLNVMFHSSEMAPKTSPSTRTQADVEESYQQLEELFTYLVYKVSVIPLTLSEFASLYQRPLPVPSLTGSCM